MTHISRYGNSRTELLLCGNTAADADFDYGGSKKK